MTLGEIVAINIRRLRLEKSLTQEALAGLVGINRNYVGMIERQEHSPTIDMVDRIAEALEVDPASLFERPSGR